MADYPQKLWKTWGKPPRLDSEAAATFGPAATDDRAPAGRPHPFAESVAALATPIMRLVRAFHRWSDPPGIRRRRLRRLLTPGRLPAANMLVKRH